MNNKHRNFKDQFVHLGVEVTGTRLHREMLQFRLRLHTSSCPALCVCVRLRACVCCSGSHVGGSLNVLVLFWNVKNESLLVPVESCSGFQLYSHLVQEFLLFFSLKQFLIHSEKNVTVQVSVLSSEDVKKTDFFTNPHTYFIHNGRIQ